MKKPTLKFKYSNFTTNFGEMLLDNKVVKTHFQPAPFDFFKP